MNAQEKARLTGCGFYLTRLMFTMAEHSLV